MRIWFSGPRIFGIRPGISIGPEDFRRAGKMSKTESRVFVVLVAGTFIAVMSAGIWIASSMPPTHFP